ncbi:ATP-binding protein [bacterium]|nr:ATP-binding protein [bacterium]
MNFITIINGKIMKIFGITSTINFGYNKQLNDTVNQKLERNKGNKELSQTLLRVNRFCNELEDNLRKAENNRQYELMETYQDIFVTTKIMIAGKIDKRFPQLNYRKTEIEGYKSEIKKRKIKNELHWLREVVDGLETGEEFKDLIDEVHSKAETKTSATQNNAATTAKSKNETCNYVEKFEPNDYSPRGFESLGGLEDVKELLRDRILEPLNNPEQAKRDEIEYGLRAPRGELFYGPPGCGKTSIMEALSMEAGVPLFKLKVGKSGSIYVNGSSLNVQKAYEYVKKIAKETGKPVFLAIDEMEAMTSKRDTKGNSEETQKLVGTLLQIIEDSRSSNVIILGATNLFDMVDDAVKSRMDDMIYIGLPDDKTREKVLQIHLNKRKKGQALASNPEELRKVVLMTKGFSNRDISILVDDAAKIARKEGYRNIIAQDFLIPVQKRERFKIKEELYKDKNSRPVIGYNH